MCRLRGDFGWLPFVSSRRLDKEVAVRIENYDSEESLMQWYCLSASKQRPQVASRDWDSAMQQAITLMGTKLMTNDHIRGGMAF